MFVAVDSGLINPCLINRGCPLLVGLRGSLCFVGETPPSRTGKTSQVNIARLDLLARSLSISVAPSKK